MRFRLWVLLLVVIPMLLTATLLTVFFVTSRLSNLEEDLERRSTALARQLAAGSELGLFSGNRQMIEKVAAAVLRDPDVAAVIVRDEGGVLMVSLGDQRAVTTFDSPSGSRPYVVGSEPVRRPVTPLDDLFPDAAEVPAGDLGSVAVIMSTESLKQNRIQIILTALLVTGGLTALVVGIVLVHVRRFGQRLAHLSETVGRIGEGDLSAQVGVSPEGNLIKVAELETLGQGVNAMARQIGAAHRDLAQRIAEATAELERRRGDAERANLAKSRFLAAASHDLRQPLHALGLFADQLSRRALSGEDGRLVGRIVETSGALSELLDALLDISRLDAGAMTPKFTSVALEPMLYRLRVDFETLADHRGLRLRIPKSKHWVSADATMLERILINLLSNAIRYTPAGAVMLAVRRRAGGKLRIEVRDSGVGIREEAQKLVFDEFVQLGNPERDRNKGLGLGLSIVQRMCVLMQYRYGVRSELGRGSVFWFELPIAAPVPAPRIDAVAPDRRMAGRQVVVIEDDPLALESLCDQLRSWGCEVCAAHSGDELLALLHARGAVPDAILCDHRLQSGESGEDIVMRVRARYSAQIPAVLVTGDSGMQLRGGAASGEMPVLSKPVRPARLRAVLQGIFPVGSSGS